MTVITAYIGLNVIFATWGISDWLVSPLYACLGGCATAVAMDKPVAMEVTSFATQPISTVHILQAAK